MRDLSNNKLCYVDKFKRINGQLFLKHNYGRIYFLYDRSVSTQDPKGDDVENCQLIGRAFEKNENEAKNNLMKENPWIKEHSFDEKMFVVKELASWKCRQATIFLGRIT